MSILLTNQNRSFAGASGTTHINSNKMSELMQPSDYPHSNRPRERERFLLWNLSTEPRRWKQGQNIFNSFPLLVSKHPSQRVHVVQCVIELVSWKTNDWNWWHWKDINESNAQPNNDGRVCLPSLPPWWSRYQGVGLWLRAPFGKSGPWAFQPFVACRSHMGPLSTSWHST